MHSLFEIGLFNIGARVINPDREGVERTLRRDVKNRLQDDGMNSRTGSTLPFSLGLFTTTRDPKPNSNTSPQTAKTSSQQLIIASANEQHQAPEDSISHNWSRVTVYIWPAKMINGHGDCGHASIGVDEFYISIWPRTNSFPSLGLLKAVPVPAENELFEHDKEFHQSHGSHARFTARLPLDIKAEHGEPDYIFHIDPDRFDVDAMQQYCKSAIIKIEEGKLGYQFLPNVPSVEAFRELSDSAIQTLAADPISGYPFEYAENRLEELCREASNLEGHNCTSLTAKILEQGGMELKAPSTPWGFTPRRLADAIEAEMEKDDVQVIISTP